MHSNRLADDESIANQFADCLAGIRVADLADFIGIEPDFTLATANHRGGKALLSPEINPVIDDLISCCR